MIMTEQTMQEVRELVSEVGLVYKILCPEGSKWVDYDVLVSTVIKRWEDQLDSDVEVDRRWVHTVFGAILAAGQIFEYQRFVTDKVAVRLANWKPVDIYDVAAASYKP